MRERCRNPNAHGWKDYGGRGIKICARWEAYGAFAADMGPRPPGFQLDRRDNDGDYTPSNCRWVDRKTQQRNRRQARFVNIDGRQYRAIELAEQAGLKTDTIIERAADGRPLSEVVSKRRFVKPEHLQKAHDAWHHQAQTKTHCRHGHELTPENTYVTKQGWRQCRTCHNAKIRRYTAAKAVARIKV